jgi:hypothetical protein
LSGSPTLFSPDSRPPARLRWARPIKAVASQGAFRHRRPQADAVGPRGSGLPAGAKAVVGGVGRSFPGVRGHGGVLRPAVRLDVVAARGLGLLGDVEIILVSIVSRLFFSFGLVNSAWQLGC